MDDAQKRMDEFQKVRGRILDLRKQAIDRDPASDRLTDIEVVLAEYDKARQEASLLGHENTALIVAQERRDREARAAARRSVEDDRAAWSQRVLDKYVREALLPITGLIYRIEQLPDRLSPKAMAAFKAATGDTARTVADARRRLDADEELALVGKQRAEILRLREYVTVAGRTLHKQLTTFSATCGCFGCDLIRGMDDLAADAGEGETS
ncbi:MAG: hypothetical protein JWO98_2562 [Frankiales bacterium]|nr:hypothetical protein [Frankiales bacterium]